MDGFVAASNGASEARPARSLAPVRRIGDGWLLEAFVVVLLTFLVWQAVPVWTMSDTEISHFPQALDWAMAPCSPRGCLRWTPGRLNAGQPGRSDIGSSVEYVGPSFASTGPFVVSIHPISPGTFAAVARGDNGRCYAEIEVTTESGWHELYAEFPRGMRCNGQVATDSSVTLGTEPQ